MTRRATWIDVFGWWLLGLLIAVGAWWNSAEHLFLQWWNVDTYGYGLLVPVMAIMLFRQRLERLHGHAPQPTSWGVLVGIPILCLWFFGDAFAIRFFEHIALMAWPWALFLALAGWRAARDMAAPFFMLLLAVPVGEALIEPLQLLTADMVADSLAMLGLVISRDGVVVELQSGFYEIARACGGVRFFLASGVFGWFLAFAMMQGAGRRLGFITLALIVPVFANYARVLAILLLAEWSGQSFAADIDHLIFGWIFLSIILAVLIAFALKLGQGSATYVYRARKLGQRTFAIAPAIVFLPLFAFSPNYLPVKLRTDFRFCTESDIQFEAMRPANASGYRPLVVGDTYVWPEAQTATREERSVWRRGADIVQLSIAFYQNESRDSGLVHDRANNLGAGWRRLPYSSGELEQLDDVSPFHWRRFGKDGRVRLVLALHIIDGVAVKTDWDARVARTMARLKYRTVPSMTVTLIAEGRQENILRDRLQGFSEQLRSAMYKAGIEDWLEGTDICAD